jgi:predicted Ser/Thr protein kinase
MTGAPQSVCTFCGKSAERLDERGHCPTCAGRWVQANAASVEEAAQLFTGPIEPDPLLGQVIGGCRLVSKVGSGGMGAVYRAEQLSLGRAVAVKIIHPDCAANPRFAARLHSEARAIAVLNHPHILQVYDVGAAEGLHYILMEFVEGPSLGDLIFQGLFQEPERCRDLLRQTLLGLGHAHTRGVIHRDLKPDNILLAAGSFVKLADFGLAKVLDAQQQLTATGMVIGTPQYMSPEAAAGRPLDPRSDLYSLGATFYHALTGTPPFTAETPMGVLYRHIHDPLVSLVQVNPAVDPGLAEVVETMLAKDPDQRFAGCEEALRSLDASRGRSPAPLPEASPTQTLVTPTPAALRAPEPVGLTSQIRLIATRPSLSPIAAVALLIAVGLLAAQLGRGLRTPARAPTPARSPAAAASEAALQPDPPATATQEASASSGVTIPPLPEAALQEAPSPVGPPPEAALDPLPIEAGTPEPDAEASPAGTPAPWLEGAAEPSHSTELSPAAFGLTPEPQALPSPFSPEAAELLSALAEASDPEAAAGLAKRVEALAAAAPPEEAARLLQRLAYLRFLKARARARTLLEGGEPEAAAAVLEAFEKDNPKSRWNEELQGLFAALRQSVAEAELRQRAEKLLDLVVRREWKQLAEFFPARRCKFPDDPNEKRVVRAVLKALGLPEGVWVEGYRIEEMRVDAERAQGWLRASLDLAGEEAPRAVQVVWQRTCQRWRLNAEPLYRGRILGIDF